VHQIFVEAAPVLAIPIRRSSEARASVSDHTVRFARCTERQHPLLALRGIGGEQVEQGRGEPRVLDLGDGLRIAARKDIALQFGRFISRFDASRMASSRRSRLASAVAISSALGPSALAGFGEQQPRFQERQPRRHHQIIRASSKANFPRRLDEHQVLVGQRQDRNLGEIDLLLPRQRQQQVERALIALDVDNQRRLAVRKFSRPSGFKTIEFPRSCARRSCSFNPTHPVPRVQRPGRKPAEPCAHPAPA